MTSHFYRSRVKLSESATLVADIQVVPETWSTENEHVLNGFCWCQPLAEAQPDGGYVYIHRRTLDSPHIEVEA